MPVACQSRDPARPQAGNPVGRTNNRRPRKGAPVVGTWRIETGFEGSGSE